MLVGRQSPLKVLCLNGEIVAQRTRPVTAVLRDLKYWRERHGVSLFVATDNILAPSHTVALPAALRQETLDIDLFFEVRAVMSRRNLAALARAGIGHLQVGIESLIPELLEMVDKGTTPILNLLFMRRAKELGIRYYWNLLYGLPRERLSWYHALIQWLPKVFHLTAPDPVRYSFQRFSPYFDDPQRYGIRVVGPIPGTQYNWDLPADEISALSYCLDFEVDGQEDDGEMVRRLSSEIDCWSGSRAELSAVCSNGRVRIIDSRPVAASGDYLLPWREGFLLRCLEQPASLDDIRARLIRHNPTAYLKMGGAAGCCRACDELFRRGLTFTERDRHLALIIPDDPAFWFESMDHERGTHTRHQVPLLHNARVLSASSTSQ